ncbi:MAG: hypothetical protein M5U08_10290 [Burkholderiales bacterium]|nr:hypothetical protein [Burkholderiales bacterium]
MKPLAELRPGDEIYGTEGRGRCRHCVRTRVLARGRSRKPAYRLRAAGASEAGCILLRVAHEPAPPFKEWLATHYPRKPAHATSLVCKKGGGQDYDATFGVRHRGTGNFAELIARRFEVARARFGFGVGRRDDLDTTRFRAPDAGRRMRLLWPHGASTVPR